LIKRFNIICIAILSLTAVRAGDLPVLTAGAIPGTEITRSEVYAGSSLWGLINGGADLFFEYGFDRMALQEISWQDEEFRLELYRMDDPSGAFGIFSVSRHGCAGSTLVVEGDCSNRYQYQFFKGNYYLSLINYSGSARAGELSMDIARVIAAGIYGDEYSLPAFLQQESIKNFLPGLKVLKGKLGLQSTLPSIMPALAGFDDYTVYYFEFEDFNGKADIALIESGTLWNAGEVVLQTPESTFFIVSLNNKHQLLIESANDDELHSRIQLLIPEFEL
jgi:hypothetical protein